MKGMQKIKRGSGFRGVLNYALDDDRGEIIGGNMAGLTTRELASEFKQSRALREDIEKPVWHNSLRLPEGERLNPEKWVTIADDYMARMGFGELHQRAYILHDEPDGQHIHIIASRIDLTGKIYLGQNENLKSTQHIAELEKAHGLTQTPQQRDPIKTNRKAVTEGEKGLEIRTEIKPPRQQLQDIIDKATHSKPRFREFIEQLHKSEVSVLPSGKTGTPQGISFELGGVAFKGSALGKDYAWKQLQARIEFDSQADQEIINQLRQNPKALPPTPPAERQKTEQTNATTAPIGEATLSSNVTSSASQSVTDAAPQQPVLMQETTEQREKRAADTLLKLTMQVRDQWRETESKKLFGEVRKMFEQNTELRKQEPKNILGLNQKKWQEWADSCNDLKKRYDDTRTEANLIKDGKSASEQVVKPQFEQNATKELQKHHPELYQALIDKAARERVQAEEVRQQKQQERLARKNQRGKGQDFER